MKTSIKIEELALLFLGIYLFGLLNYKWWWFLVFILAPDIGMIGYLINTKIGAFTYNLFHHRAIAVLVFLTGIYLNSQSVQFAGIIIFSHAAMDRIFGYGLKYPHSFSSTHLGKIGKDAQNTKFKKQYF